MRWVFQLDHVRVVHGDKPVFDDVTLTFLQRARIGVVGPNGAGKSTILKVIAGLEPLAGGDMTLAPDTTVGILLQEPPLDETTTVLGNIEDGVAETKQLLARFDEITTRLTREYSDELLAEMGRLQGQLDHADAWSVDSRLEQAMSALGCPPADTEVARLSGGERRRVALCQLLLRQPDLLLLDEPTNHLDTESVQWLEQHLAFYPGTVIAVTHDRYFLENVAEWILELDRGQAYPYEGNYATYLETKNARLIGEGKRDAKNRRLLARELEWVRSGAQARHTKAKSRLARYEQMADAAERARKLDFDDIQIPAGPRLGQSIVEATGVTKRFGSRTIIDDLSFSVPRNGIVGVLGPNGVGKTTLFEMIVGRQRPDSGTIRVGDSVRFSYVDQDRVGLDPDATAWELVSGGRDSITVGQVEIPSRAYIAAFGFKGPDQQKPARRFSGGERNRLNLALTLRQGGNVLLLDEPTNDLDTETLASLEEGLLAFPGCVMVTAHDRWFLDRVATHILAWEGTADDPGRWFWFEGNFAGYEQNKVERLGEAAGRPRRAVHRRLTRD